MEGTASTVCVVLLKSPSPTSSTWLSTFSPSYCCHECSPLKFSFLNEDSLVESLRSLLTFPNSLVIATSPRGVESICMAIAKLLPSDCSLFRSNGVRLLFMGKGSKRVFIDFAHSTDWSVLSECIVEEDFRNADEVADFALRLCESDVSHRVKCLICVGERRLATLTERFQREGVEYEEIITYRSEDDDGAIRELLKSTHFIGGCDGPKEVWMALFAPSGVGVLRNAMRRMGTGEGKGSGEQKDQIGIPDHFYLAAIGMTTKTAIESAGWKCYAVAEDPTPERLREAIDGARDAVRKKEYNDDSVIERTA